MCVCVCASGFGREGIVCRLAHFGRFDAGAGRWSERGLSCCLAGVCCVVVVFFFVWGIWGWKVDRCWRQFFLIEFVSWSCDNGSVITLRFIIRKGFSCKNYRDSLVKLKQMKVYQFVMVFFTQKFSPYKLIIFSTL